MRRRIGARVRRRGGVREGEGVGWFEEEKEGGEKRVECRVEEGE